MLFDWAGIKQFVIGKQGRLVGTERTSPKPSGLERTAAVRSTGAARRDGLGGTVNDQPHHGLSKERVPSDLRLILDSQTTESMRTSLRPCLLPGGGAQFHKEGARDRKGLLRLQARASLVTRKLLAAHEGIDRYASVARRECCSMKGAHMRRRAFDRTKVRNGEAVCLLPTAHHRRPPS